MQNFEEKNSNGLFELTYKVLCREKNVKPLPMIEMYLQKNCLRFSIDHVNLKDWSPILNSIIQDRSLSKIWIYSRRRHKTIKKKVITEEKLVKLRLQVTSRTTQKNGRWNLKKYNNANTYILKLQKWQMDWHSTCTFRRCAPRDQQQPILYTNFLLSCFVHSIAVCLMNSLMITSLTLDGIPLAPKYLKILGDGLISNRNLRSLSLARCRINDAGCNILLENLQYNSSLHILNLSSCCLSDRSAAYLSLFLKKRKADLLQNVWQESTNKLSRENISTTTDGGLQVLILDRNYKVGDVGLRQLLRILKNDYWLKKLHLRCCGITQHGGEIVLEFLQTNSVLAEIDLRDNELPIDMLQTIYNILKRRKSKRERILTKKRLLCHKQDMITKNSSLQHISKENLSSNNQTYFQSKMQYNYSSQASRSTHIWKTKGKSNRNCQSHIMKKNYIKWTNADELKKCLSLMIERNQELITELENTTDFLTKEKNRRLIAEEAYYKIRPQLENLRNKITMQNSIHLNMYYENQVYTNVQNVFKNLKIFANEKKMMRERSLEKES